MHRFDHARENLPRFPVKTIGIGIASMVVLLVFSTYLTWRMGEQIRTVMESQIKVLTAAERIDHYGSVLELSIKAVVATGDQEAAARYRNLQPRLRRTLTELRSALQLSENKAAAREVDRADLQLVAMEHEALELASKGRSDEARRIIDGPKYDHLMKIYFDGIHGIERRAERYVEASERRFDRYLWTVTGLSLASFLIAMLGWFVLIGPARRWGEQLDLARTGAEATSRQLQDSKVELELLNQQLFRQARIDPLTKLGSRLKCSEDLQQLWPNAQRYGDSYCAVMCDVDCFKQYNDGYGHLAGDRVLRAVADAMSATCRAGDHVYRYGGEEFLVILRVASAAEAAVAAERFRAAVEELRIAHGGSPSGVVTISMGAAQLCPERTASAESWLNEADGALYEAKRAGRNRVVLSSARGAEVGRPA